MDNGEQDRTDAGGGCLMLFILWWALVVIAGIGGGIMYLWSVLTKGLGLG